MGKLTKFENNQMEHDEPEKWVSMTNALARASHGLTLAEKRIIMLSVAKLDSRRDPYPGECPNVKITAQEYAESFNIDTTTAYEALEAAAKVFYERSITFYDPSWTRLKKNQRPPVTRMRWIGSATYHQKEGWVEMGFWHEVVPHLMGLRKQFTSYQLMQTVTLRSTYSWKLLELVESYSNTGWFQMTIEDFCTSMEATDLQRANFNNIRRKMIEPAVRELQEKDGWLIRWRPILAGRRVKALRFDFQRSAQKKLFAQPDAPLIHFPSGEVFQPHTSK